jgi:Leucine-rich repeat (LRR) protein
VKNLLGFGFVLVFILSPLISISRLVNKEFDCINVTEIPQSECEALVALYNNTNGAGWADSTNWLTTNIPSNWFGVREEYGHVTELVLSRNKLSGSVPAELDNLSNLKVLDLCFNNLVGNIPPDLGYLSSISYLDLSANQLTGSIPVELANLVNLSALRLWGNKLTGAIPLELSSLSNLWELQLFGNQLTGAIPSELESLSNLYYLGLGDNRLSGPIPPELGNLTNLDQLSLSNNILSGSIPPQLGNLCALKILDLSNNQLSGSIPAELGYLGDMRILRLEQNQLDGDVPESLVNLNRLGDWTPETTGLDLDYNELNIPPGYPNIYDPLHMFLAEHDPEWHTRQAFEQVIGSDGGTLTALDGSMEFVIHAGALDGDTTFTYTPQPSPSSLSTLLTFANISFHLTAEDEWGSSVTIFDPPIIAKINYDDENLYGLTWTTLVLLYWDEASSIWIDSVNTCSDGEYHRDQQAQTLTLSLCHLTEYALYGKLFVYLPMLRIER